MDYGALIQRAWDLTRRNRFLWVLGLFATSTVGSCSPSGVGTGPAQWQAGSPDFERLFSPDLVRTFQEADRWLSVSIGWIILGVLLALSLVVIVFFFVSFAAQGGMALATTDLALGRESSLAIAWRSGLGMFWHYLLLWLLLTGLVVAFLAVVVVLIGIAVAIGIGLEGASRATLAVVGAILLVLGLIVTVPLLIAGTVAVALAQRAIAVERTGAWSALGLGIRLIRRNPGTSFLAWVVSLALGIVAGIIVALAAVVLAIPLGAVGFGVYAWSGVSTMLASYGIAALIVFIAILWGVGGVANAFFWNYWTLTYLYMTGRLTRALEPAPPT
ncbi:MAG TPA: hypothetical protein VF960_14640 [Chloroflexota bacterium]